MASHFALFADLENCGGKKSMLMDVIERVKIRGDILIGKVYGYTDAHSDLKETLLSNTFAVVPSLRYGRSQKVMYDALSDAYARAGADIQAPLIPVGSVIQALRALPPFDYAHGGISLCRDGFHLSMTLGRYAAAAVWYMALVKERAEGKLIPECFSEEERKLVPCVLETAERVLKGFRG